MGKEYLRIEIEEKGFNIDLEYIDSKDIKLRLGLMTEDKKEFKSQKTITLKDLENGGFKIE